MAVWVVRYSVVIGLKLQGINVVRVSVQVVLGLGAGFALKVGQHMRGYVLEDTDTTRLSHKAATVRTEEICMSYLLDLTSLRNVAD